MRRRLASLAVVATLAACPKPSTPPPSPTTTATTAAPVTRYVLASTLKLREAPRDDARVRGRLEINSPLEVLEDTNGFARVRVKNGREGYVASAFLGREPLTVELVRARAATSSPAEQLSWWQRAAALEPTNTVVLGELRDRYLALEQTAAATMVSTLIASIDAAAHTGRALAWSGTLLDWRPIVAAEPPPAGEVAREQWASLGLDDTTELWTLRGDGPAVRVTPARVTRAVWNECGGDFGVSVGVVDGEGGLLAWHGPPPSSWSTPATPWPAERLAALQATLRAEQCKGTDDKACTIGGVSALGHGAFFRVITMRTTDEEDPQWQVVDLFVDEAGARTQIADRRSGGFIIDTMPTAMRDVLGDSTPEIVFQGECNTVVQSIAGYVLFESAFRCCGC